MCLIHTLRTPSFRFDLNSLMCRCFRLCMRQHIIVKNFNVRWDESDKKGVVVKCVDRRCKWSMRASRLPHGKTFEMKIMASKHSCFGVNKCGNRSASSKWVTMMLGDVKENPEIIPKERMNIVDKNFSIKLPYGRAWRARERAKELIFGNVEKSHSYVLALKLELVATLIIY